jgi:hypothetical protein
LKRVKEAVEKFGDPRKKGASAWQASVVRLSAYAWVVLDGMGLKLAVRRKKRRR